MSIPERRAARPLTVTLHVSEKRSKLPAQPAFIESQAAILPQAPL
jgi:hypothetical protein